MAYLTDGHQTIITLFALGTGVTLLLKETSVTPPSLEGGDANDTTTMRNTKWRTKQPQPLIELGDGQIEFQYDPAIYEQILQILNVNGVVRWDFSDGSALEHYGWIRNFTPGACVVGAMPTATATIIGGNQDESGNEVYPDYQAAAA
jgi:hypothetical protein